MLTERTTWVEGFHLRDCGPPAPERQFSFGLKRGRKRAIRTFTSTLRNANLPALRTVIIVFALRRRDDPGRSGGGSIVGGGTE